MNNKFKCLKPFKFNFEGLECDLEFDLSKCYEDGSRIVRVKKRKNEKIAFPFATLSQHIPGVELEEDEFVLNNWDMYIKLVNFLLDETDYFHVTEKTVATSYGESPIWKLK